MKRDRTVTPPRCRRFGYRYRRRRVVDPFPGEWRAPGPAWAGFACTAGWHPLWRLLVVVAIAGALGRLCAGP